MFGDAMSALLLYFRQMRWPWGRGNNSELTLYGNKSFSHWSVGKRCFPCMVNFPFVENDTEKKGQLIFFFKILTDILCLHIENPQKFVSDIFWVCVLYKLSLCVLI